MFLTSLKMSPTWTLPTFDRTLAFCLNSVLNDMEVAVFLIYTCCCEFRASMLFLRLRFIFRRKDSSLLIRSSGTTATFSLGTMLTRGRLLVGGAPPRKTPEKN